MLRRRHHPQTQAAGKAEGRQKAHEVLWFSEHSAGGIHRSVEDMKTGREPKVESRGPGSETASAANVPSSGGAPLILRWFISRTVRQATAMRKHVHRILCAQRDILSPQAVGAVASALTDLQKTLHSRSTRDALQSQMEDLEKIANKWLKPYPNAAWRENIEVLLVALAVAMGIRTFFLQPFKIPTGSMQPTLFGVTSEDLLKHPDFKRPTGWGAVKEWFGGVSYVHKVAKSDGEVRGVNPP